MVLTLQKPVVSLNALKIRNNINSALKKAGETKLLVATVALLQLKKSIVIITILEPTAKQLLSKKEV